MPLPETVQNTDSNVLFLTGFCTHIFQLYNSAEWRNLLKIEVSEDKIDKLKWVELKEKYAKQYNHSCLYVKPIIKETKRRYTRSRQRKSH